MSTNEQFSSRLEKAAKILNRPIEDLQSYLDLIGIANDDFGFQLLEAETTTKQMITDAFRRGLHEENEKIHNESKVVLDSTAYTYWPEARLSAAIATLKGEDVFSKKESVAPTTVVYNTSTTSNSSDLLKDSIPLANRKDRSLLEDFILEEDLSVQEELDFRAKGHRFIVVDHNEKIQLELSLDLLKRARRGEEIPEIIPIGNDRAAVYPIQSFRRENRTRDESPLVPGNMLFKGYCDQCDEDFSSIEESSRKFIRLIVEYTNSSSYKNSKFHKFDLHSHSDRKAIMASASRGVEDLRKTWPSVARIYDDRAAAGTLPSLKIVNPIVRKKSDPFHTNGNQTY